MNRRWRSSHMQNVLLTPLPSSRRLPGRIQGVLKEKEEESRLLRQQHSEQVQRDEQRRRRRRWRRKRFRGGQGAPQNYVFFQWASFHHLSTWGACAYRRKKNFGCPFSTTHVVKAMRAISQVFMKDMSYMGFNTWSTGSKRFWNQFTLTTRNRTHRYATHASFKTLDLPTPRQF